MQVAMMVLWDGTQQSGQAGSRHVPSRPLVKWYVAVSDAEDASNRGREVTGQAQLTKLGFTRGVDNNKSQYRNQEGTD
jgi:hypothetical protein